MLGMSPATVAFRQKQKWFCRCSHGALQLASSHPQLLFAPLLTSSCEALQVAQHGCGGQLGSDQQLSWVGKHRRGLSVAQQGPCPQGAVPWARPGTADSQEPRTRVLPSAAGSAWLLRCPGQPLGRGRSGKGSAGSAWIAVPPWRWVGCLAVALCGSPWTQLGSFY